MLAPTEEQQRVIHHDSGHARVLSVAGSGKTTTMVLRIAHIIRERRLDPRLIRALMFNRLAADQFTQHLQRYGVRCSRGPFVSTFHSFAYQFIQKAIGDGILPRLELWVGDQTERFRLLVVQTIRVLEKAKQIPADGVDPDEAVEAIGLWKGALILPAHAGHRHNPHIPKVFVKVEEERKRRGVITFDDFVPIVVNMLEKDDALRRTWCGRVDHLIVDEYQDVNRGQQRLVELLAGNRAEVMVVGDDDQTIYEWRGARPDYIIRGFQQAFPNKPHTSYKLTRSFRFGPMIAQVAQNVIVLNANRQDKDLIANQVDLTSRIVLLTESSEQETDVLRDMADEVARLVSVEAVPPSRIWVLGRVFAQLGGLESRFLARGVPYRVVGGRPFFERAEIQKLLDYLRVALAVCQPIDADWRTAFLGIANTPGRMLPRAHLESATRTAMRNGWTGERLLTELAATKDGSLHSTARDNVVSLKSLLLEVLRRASPPARSHQPTNAGELLEWVVEQSELRKHYEDFFGHGEASLERLRTIEAFVSWTKPLRGGGAAWAAPRGGGRRLDGARTRPGS